MEQLELIARLQQGRYGDTPSEIFELGRGADALHHSLKLSERKKWLRQNAIHPDTWAKVVAVGVAEPLHQSEIANRLPASLSTLSLLARCSRSDLQELDKQDLLTPNLSYRTLAAWRRNREEEKAKRAPLLQILPIAVAVEPGVDQIDELAIQTAIQQALDSLAVKGLLIHLQGWERLEEQATEQWQIARLEEGREMVNRQISPHSISQEELQLPLDELKSAMAALDTEQWGAVYALKNAEMAVNGATKQRRYTSRNRLQKIASNGSELAQSLLKEVIGLRAITEKDD